MGSSVVSSRFMRTAAARCARSLSRSCSPISASPRRIRDRTYRTTTRFPRRASRRSSTDPTFPERFGCIEDARAYCVDFFDWYNGEHHHSGIGLNTPNDVHYGRAQQRREERGRILIAAHPAHPERFVRGVPQPPQLPTAVWINKPIADQSDQIENNSLN